MPAQALEQQLADAVLGHIRDRLPAELLADPSVHEIERVGRQLDELASGTYATGHRAILRSIERANVAAGKLEISLDANAVATRLELVPSSINPEALRFTVPFQFRKRGVESKLIIGAAQSGVADQTLIRSIAKAHQYYDELRQGRTFDDIAASQNLTRRRILQVIELAFLAPDIVKSVIQGDQPIGMTAKWLGQNPLPSEWNTQRKIVDRL